jgi:hypothetical protein
MLDESRCIISLAWTHSCQRPVLNNVKDQRPLPLIPRALRHGFERTGRTNGMEPTRFTLSCQVVKLHGRAMRRL